MRFIYVEDDPHDADLLQREIRRQGLNVVVDVAPTVRQAKERLNSNAGYDLALIDLKLPDGSGLELLAEIRRRELPLAVVILTGQGDEEAVLAALKAGADDYLVKRGEYLSHLPQMLEAALECYHREAGRRANHINVLYVEHNSPDMDLTVRHLARHAPHIMIDTLHSAQTAFQRLAAHPYDVLLLDYRLPGINALEMIKQLKQEMKSEIPVVLITGQGDEEIAFQAMRLGAVGYLSKQTGYLYQLPSILENAHYMAQLTIEKRKLSNSEGKFRRLTENIPDLVYHFSLVPKIHVEYISPQSTAMIGYTPDEHYADPLLGLKIVHPEDRHLMQAAYEGRFAFDQPVAMRWIHKDGHTIWTEHRTVPIRDESGNIIAVEGVARDITRQKCLEGALRQQLKQLETLYAISARLSAANTLEDMLPPFLHDALHALDISSGAVALKMPAENEWIIRAGHGFFSSYINQSWKSHEAPGYSSILSIPILNGTHQVGKLLIAIPFQRSISPDETKLLTSLADIAGVAIQRIRYSEETSRRYKQLQSLRLIDIAITSDQSLESTLAILVDQVASQPHTDAVCVFLLNQVSGQMEYAAGKGFHSNAIQETKFFPGQGIIGKAMLEKQVFFALQYPAEVREAYAARYPEETFQNCVMLPLVVKGKVIGVLGVFQYKVCELDPEWFSFIEALAGQAAIALDNAALFGHLEHTNQELRKAYDATIEGWARALELRDHETQGHSRNVSKLTVHIAKTLGFDLEKLIHVYRGALLHDIGKIGIPDAILLKPGTLTEEEWSIMRRHPMIAYEMLYPIEYLRPALHIPYSHHEKWDGSGYPRGLQHEEIPLEARIFSIVDVYDALISRRPYRSAWTVEETLSYIQKESGRHFDPMVVDAFLSYMQKNMLPAGDN